MSKSSEERHKGRYGGDRTESSKAWLWGPWCGGWPRGKLNPTDFDSVSRIVIEMVTSTEHEMSLLAVLHKKRFKYVHVELLILANNFWEKQVK